MSNPARAPLYTFCILLFGGVVVLLGSDFPAAALLFLVGLYPGSVQSGTPGYRLTEHYHLQYYWAAFVCVVYIALLVLAWRKRSAFVGWLAVALLLLTGLGGCARLLRNIPGDF